jgi:hypothetical protein
VRESKQLSKQLEPLLTAITLLTFNWTNYRFKTSEVIILLQEQIADVSLEERGAGAEFWKMRGAPEVVQLQT